MTKSATTFRACPASLVALAFPNTVSVRELTANGTRGLCASCYRCDAAARIVRQRGMVLCVDTALSVSLEARPTVGDFLVHFRDTAATKPTTIVVSARYTRPVDVAQAVELARDAHGEFLGPVPPVVSVEETIAVVGAGYGQARVTRRVAL